MSTRRPESSYQALARELRGQILQGRFADGQRLPTEAELAEHYRLSRQTVRRAFQDLVAEGMVHRVPGRGTFAAPKDGRYIRQMGSVEDLMSLSADTHLEVTVPLHRHVDVTAASRLRLASDAVHSITFRRLHNTTPFCLTTVHLPPDVAATISSMPGLLSAGSTSEATIIGLLDAKLKAPIAEAQQSITVEVADTSTAASLGCDEGHPLLRIDRLYLDTEDRPVELAISHFLPEHYSYRISLRRSVT
ncbi:GntR family transcriptional regulator [Dactylosporangium sp. CA-092794]|uniref:GntR family transcriptional regulator n=1 Tax=Dactylosporangium sp. CA-092794 TaxID=3239929 RepID=UPI003D8A8F9E